MPLEEKRLAEMTDVRRQFPELKGALEGEIRSTNSFIKSAPDSPTALRLFSQYKKIGAVEDSTGQMSRLVVESPHGRADVLDELKATGLPANTKIRVNVAKPVWGAYPYKDTEGNTIFETGPISDLLDLRTLIHEAGHAKQFQEEEFEQMQSQFVPEKTCGALQYLTNKGVGLPVELSELFSILQSWKALKFARGEARPDKSKSKRVEELYFAFIGGSRTKIYEHFFDNLDALARICREKDANLRVAADFKRIEHALKESLDVPHKPTKEQITFHALTPEQVDNGIRPSQLDDIALSSYKRTFKHKFVGSWQEVFDSFWNKISAGA